MDDELSAPSKKTALDFDLNSFSRARGKSSGKRLSSVTKLSTSESKTNPNASTANENLFKGLVNQSKGAARKRLSSLSNIHRLSAEDAERVRAGQALGDVRAVAKELLENALDAGASRIDVTLRGPGGLDGVIVSDDGCGVKSEDFLDLCAAGATSKKEGGTTFGFRGAALSSVCATSKAVRVVTRTSEPNSSAFSLEYSTRGVLTMRKPAARRAGTTVEACEIFKNLPVRRTAVKNHAPREIAKVVAMVQAYALVSSHTRIELRAEKQQRLCYVPLSTERGTRDAEREIDLSLLRHATRAILGENVLRKLVDFKADGLGAENGVRANISGLVSSGAGGSAKGSGKGSSSSPQFVFINRRPVDMARLTRAVNDAYRRGTNNPGARPSFILNLALDPGSVDVNLAPDKRAVLCEGEPAIVNALSERLEKLWAPTNENSIPKSADVRSMLTLSNGCIDNLEKADLTQFCSQASERDGVKESDFTATGGSESKVVDATGADNNLPDGVSVHESPFCSRKCTSLTASQDLKLLPTMDNFTEEHDSAARSSKRTRPQETQSNSPPERLSLAEEFSHFREMEDDVSPSRSPKRSRILNFGLGSSLAPRNEQVRKGTSGTIVDLVGDYSGSSESESPDSKKNSRVDQPHSANDQQMRAIVESFKDSVFKPPNRLGKSTPPLPPLKKVSPELQRLHNDGIVRKTNTGNFQREPSRWRNVMNDSIPNAPSKQPFVISPRDVPVPDHPAFLKKPVSVREKLDSSAGNRVYSKKIVANMDWDAILNPQRSENEEIIASASENDEEQLPKLDFQDASMAVVSEEESRFQHVKAMNQLKRTFKKEWFEKMEVLGQFNLGFFICRLGQDLFIIDQHASDEIRNFEELKAIRPATQILVKPLLLNLSAEEELLVAEHLENFDAGGYKLKFYPERMPTKRLELISQPSRSSFYVMDDIADMAASIKFNPPLEGEPLTPRRTRGIIASKACRRSVMVGDPLQPARMQRIVANLARLKRPWACPHGRPTFLHLCMIPRSEQEDNDTATPELEQLNE